MPKVLISYRHESDAHAQQVRALAERLRDRVGAVGIELVLDQFLLDTKPGGPTEGWPKWCSRQVKESGRVVMIVSPGWADCFNGDEPRDAGEGAAGEAHVIWQELSAAHWRSDKFRVCLLDPAYAECIPTELKSYQRFTSPREDDALCAWLQEMAEPGPLPVTGQLVWPAVRPDFRHDLADRTKVFDFFQRMLSGQTGDRRILLIRAEGNHGKTVLLAKFTEYAQGLVPWALVDLKGAPSAADVLLELNSELKKRLPHWIRANTLGEALSRIEETAQSRPILLLFDTYEKSAEEICRTIENSWLGAVRRAEGLCVVISGRKTRNDGQPVLADWSKTHWARWAEAVELDALPKLEDWEAWARAKHPGLTPAHIEALAVGMNGVPGNVAAALDTLGTALERRTSF